MTFINKFSLFKKESLILEKSTLTNFGVPNNVMKSIQKDLAISDNAEWEKINFKRDIILSLRKNEKNLFLQISVSSIKVIVSYPTPKGIEYFVDPYFFKDDEWNGEYIKKDRIYKSLTQIIIDINLESNIYKLNGDFSIIKQMNRKLFKKEKEFNEFNETFKIDFLQQFDRILKRITGTHFKEEKGKITDKAKQIALENKLLIQGLDNPLVGDNGLTILDEFIYQFEEKYTDFFGERLDIEEITKYFSREKTMTMLMYFLKTGKLML